jgi:hypothetical protein
LSPKRQVQIRKQELLAVCLRALLQFGVDTFAEDFLLLAVEEHLINEDISIYSIVSLISSTHLVQLGEELRNARAHISKGDDVARNQGIEPDVIVLSH